MPDIRHPEPQNHGNLPDGAGIKLAFLGGLAVLPLIVAAIMSGKPLWMVLTIWALGGPAVTVALGLVALRQRDCTARRTRVPQERNLRHV